MSRRFKVRNISSVTATVDDFSGRNAEALDLVPSNPTMIIFRPLVGDRKVQIILSKVVLLDETYHTVWKFNEDQV